MSLVRGRAPDQPKIAMRVEQGRLVPVGQFDVELLAAFREGAIVEIRAILAQTRPLERRYFATLTEMLKAVDTPWTVVHDAHEAIKAMLGFVEPYQKKDKTWGAHPRSIATFSDQELEEYFKLYCELARARYGFDPETGELSQSSDHPTNVSGPDGAPGVDPIPADVGERLASVSNHPTDAPEAGGGLVTPRGSPPAEGLGPVDLDWLKTVARMLVSATGGAEEVDTLARQKHAIKQFLTPGEIGLKARGIAQQIYLLCKASCADGTPLDKQKIAAMAHCTIADLRPEAR